MVYFPPMKMKKYTVWILLLLLGLALILAYGIWKQPDDYRKMRQEEVGLPVYPGLRGLGGSGEGTIEIAGKTVDILPAVYGDTLAPLEKVVAFYSKKLPGWNQRNIGGAYYFWSGGNSGDFNPAGPEGMKRVSIHLKQSLDDTDRVSVSYFIEPR